MGKEIKWNNMTLGKWVDNIDKIECVNMTKEDNGMITLADYCTSKQCENSRLCMGIESYLYRTITERNNRNRFEEMLKVLEIEEFTQLFKFTFNPNEYPVTAYKNKIKTVSGKDIEMYMAFTNLFSGEEVEYRDELEQFQWKKALNKRQSIERGVVNRKKTQWIKSVQINEYYGCPRCESQRARQFIDKEMMKNSLIQAEELFKRYKCVDCGNVYDDPVLYVKQVYTEDELKEKLAEVGIEYDKIYLYANNPESVERIEAMLKEMVEVPKFTIEL